MTYNEFINLQVGDMVKINSEDITYGDSCIVIIINKKLSKESPNVVDYYCKLIYPNKFQELMDWYDDTSLILCIDERNATGTFCYGYVDVNWSIGYAKCRSLDGLTIFKGDI